jgi:hypothetical protein
MRGQYLKMNRCIAQLIKQVAKRVEHRDMFFVCVQRTEFVTFENAGYVLTRGNASLAANTTWPM